MQNRNELASGCGGKRQYSTNAAAVQAAISLHKRASKGKPNAYYCAVCGGFHIGRKGMPTKPRIEHDEDNMLLEKFRGKTTSEITEKTFGENCELSWLAQRVARGAKEPFSEIATITPSIAKHILEKNNDNRKVREPLVNQIASDIKNGLWQLNGESIIISKDGILNDGQHRLNAVIESGVPIKTVIMFGVSRSSRHTVDMGAARTASDLLGMDGEKNVVLASGIARQLMAYRKGHYAYGGGSGNYSPTKQAVYDYYNHHSREIQKAANVIQNGKFFCKTGPTSWGVAYIILSKLNIAEAEVFFSKCATGESLKRNDPILMLRMHFNEIGKQRLKTFEKLELIIRYWNAWRQGKPLSRRISLHGEYPEIEV